MNPDDVCNRYSERGVKLSISLLDDETVLIEGDRLSLEFLSDFIRAQAEYDRDCGSSIGPRSAGNTFFDKKSSLGIYVHRIHGSGERNS